MIFNFEKMFVTTIGDQKISWITLGFMRFTVLVHMYTNEEFR